jgi:CheY-like chemotaxis protein
MKKILVVDDQKEIRDLLKEKLVKEKFFVATASNGEEAISVSKNSKPDLILLDIGMPKMDGYLTCEKLKEDPLLATIPVLFLTGKDLDPESVVEHCQELSAAGYISKLSSLKELLEKIREVLFIV